MLRTYHKFKEIPSALNHQIDAFYRKVWKSAIWWATNESLEISASSLIATTFKLQKLGFLSSNILGLALFGTLPENIKSIEKHIPYNFSASYCIPPMHRTISLHCIIPYLFVASYQVPSLHHTISLQCIVPCISSLHHTRYLHCIVWISVHCI